MDDEITRQEIETALTTLLEEGIGYHHEHIGPNHSLAQGDFGNLEVLLMATQTLATPHLYAARERYTAQLLESRNQHGWLMGAPLNVETPGLMIGLAGIGYELLRLGEPDNVPSVLILAPPVVRKV
jgi:lantibiotic modifying enzyme